MKLAFIGVGYVGLVTGACMAELGHTVVCADVDKKKIAKLKRGVMPIYELGLEELVMKNVKEGRLSFTPSVAAAMKASEVVFSGVGTPEDKKTGKADMQYVHAVAREFGKHLNGYKILVNKSTVPVGTADIVRDIVTHASNGKHEFDIVSNPEFLREGAAIKDFLNPDRVVVGVASDRAKAIMEKIYRPIARTGRPVMMTDIRSAELIKYASNAFLATKITFANELANFCELVGANIKEVSKGMGLDSRIGSRFLYAGIGYGGSCFPKDVQALMETGKEYQFDFSIYVAEALLKAGARVRAFDPVAMENFSLSFADKRLKYTESAYDAVEGADALLVMTEWDEFRTTEYPELAARMKDRVIIDGRNIFDRTEAEAEGFVYYGIGV